jgi:hypothetical protein
MRTYMSETAVEPISVIVPTIGRPQSVHELLVSLMAQTIRAHEIIIADARLNQMGSHNLATVSSNDWIKAAAATLKIYQGAC